MSSKRNCSLVVGGSAISRTDARFAAHSSTGLVLRRFGYGSSRGEVVQLSVRLASHCRLVGNCALCLHLLPGPIQSDAPALVAARYVVRGPDDFVGGGVWRLFMDIKGVVTAIDHEPDDLPLQDQDQGLQG